MRAYERTDATGRVWTVIRNPEIGWVAYVATDRTLMLDPLPTKREMFAAVDSIPAEAN